jgi:hypothetical protein
MAMMVEDRKRVAAGGVQGCKWHMIPIADIDLIAEEYPEGRKGS